jgi:hypothetical protein
MDMRFGIWNIQSFYGAGFLKTASKELSNYNLDLMGLQEVRQDRSGTEPAEKYTFFYGKLNETPELGTGIFLHKKIISKVNSIESVNDTMSYIILRGCRCQIIVLNVYALTEDNTDDVKDSF